MFQTSLYCRIMTDSDDDIPIVRLNSGPKRYSVVPQDLIYRIRVIDVEKHGIEYTLKEGKNLPHETELAGTYLNFLSKDSNLFQCYLFQATNLLLTQS